MARSLLAQFDDDRVVAYQAYDEQLGAEILARGSLGGGWRYDRHTRLQTGVAFTANRYDFGRRPDRTRIVAISLSRDGFDALLMAALTAEWDERLYKTKASWRLATRFAPVLVEWVGDAPRFVVHGALLRRMATEWVVGLEDVSAVFRALCGGGPAPEERPYPVPSDVASRLGLS